MMKGKSPLVLSLVLAVLICLTGRVQADIPINLQVAIFFKILSYDDNLPSRSPTKVVMVVIADKATASQKSEAVAGFKTIAEKGIQGRPLVVEGVDFVSAAKLGADVAAKGGNILYLSGNSEEATIRASLDLAQSKKIPLLTDSEQLAKRGFAVGLTVEDKKPKIIVNLPASKAQGMKLSARVLQLATIIE